MAQRGGLDTTATLDLRTSCGSVAMTFSSGSRENGFRASEPGCYFHIVVGNQYRALMQM